MPAISTVEIVAAVIFEPRTQCGAEWIFACKSLLKSRFQFSPFRSLSSQKWNDRFLPQPVAVSHRLALDECKEGGNVNVSEASVENGVSETDTEAIGIERLNRKFSESPKSRRNGPVS